MKATLDKIQTKDEANFLEELVASAVRMAVRKSVEYPIANIRSAEDPQRRAGADD